MTITKKTKRLLNNEDFQDIVLNGYIKDGLINLSLNENVDNQSVRDELKARRILNDYLKQCLDFDNIEKIRKE